MIRGGEYIDQNSKEYRDLVFVETFGQKLKRRFSNLPLASYMVNLNPVSKMFFEEFRFHLLWSVASILIFAPYMVIQYQFTANLQEKSVEYVGLTKNCYGFIPCFVLYSNVPQENAFAYSLTLLVYIVFSLVVYMARWAYSD